MLLHVETFGHVNNFWSGSSLAMWEGPGHGKNLDQTIYRIMSYSYYKHMKDLIINIDPDRMMLIEWRTLYNGGFKLKFQF